MSYMIYEQETCPVTGKIHLQGYMRLKKKTRFNTVKKMLHDSCHLEAAKGTEESNITYCSKERDKSLNWKEWGVPQPDAGRQGARHDLDPVIDDINKGLHSLFFYE